MVDITDLKSVEPKALAGSSPAAGTSFFARTKFKFYRAIMRAPINNILAPNELARKIS